MLVCSYNPAYRSSLKELKPSFRQRFAPTVPAPIRWHAHHRHERRDAKNRRGVVDLH